MNPTFVQIQTCKKWCKTASRWNSKKISFLMPPPWRNDPSPRATDLITCCTLATSLSSLNCAVSLWMPHIITCYYAGLLRAIGPYGMFCYSEVFAAENLENKMCASFFLTSSPSFVFTEHTHVWIRCCCKSCFLGHDVNNNKSRRLRPLRLLPSTL